MHSQKYGYRCRLFCKIDLLTFYAGVVKLVDTLDLGSSASRREGSSPFARTKYIKAQMAKLVDALVSGTSVSNDVQVRVLFWALKLLFLGGFFYFYFISSFFYTIFVEAEI